MVLCLWFEGTIKDTLLSFKFGAFSGVRALKWHLTRHNFQFTVLEKWTMRKRPQRNVSLYCNGIPRFDIELWGSVLMYYDRSTWEYSHGACSQTNFSGGTFLNIYGRNRKNKFRSCSLDAYNSRPLFDFSESVFRATSEPVALVLIQFW